MFPEIREIVKDEMKKIKLNCQLQTLVLFFLNIIKEIYLNN